MTTPPSTRDTHAADDSAPPVPSSPAERKLAEIVPLVPRGQTIIGGRYRIVAGPMAGGHAFVYQAIDEELDRFVAVKMPRRALSEKAYARFVLEALEGARLQHESIVRILDWSGETPQGAPSGVPYLVTEWIGGPQGQTETLADFLAAEGRLAPEIVATFAMALCEALGALHAQGLIHRDLKPGNILIHRERGFFKLGDLGVVHFKLLHEEAPLTEPGERLGTPAYMSPEQAAGEPGEPIDERSDLFSLGVTLYELLTGARPFAGEGEAVVEQIRQGVYPPLEDPRIPRYLVAIVHACLARAPEDRPADAVAVWRRLESGLRQQELGEVPLQMRRCLMDPNGYGEFLQRRMLERALLEAQVGAKLVQLGRAAHRETTSQQATALLHEAMGQVVTLLPEAQRAVVMQDAAMQPANGNGCATRSRPTMTRWRVLAVALVLVVGGLGVWQGRRWWLQAQDPARAALGRGHFVEALRLTAPALERNPADASALWVRGVALEKRALTMTAAAVFERLVKRDASPWHKEAEAHRSTLQAMDEQVKRAWQALMARGRAMVAGGPVPLDLVKSYPGYMRIFYYDAVRAAPEVERLEQLRPLARALDLQFGGAVLEEHLDRVVAGWSAARARLARTYAKLAADPSAWATPDRERFLTALRQTGQADMILGTLLLTRTVGEHVAEYQALARESHDPWFELSAARAQADQDRVAGKRAVAIERLQRTVQRCQALRLGYACTQFELSLAVHYRLWHQLAEAYRYAHHGWMEALKAGDWPTIAGFLWELRSIANAQGDRVFTQAYGEEAELRDPVGCYPQQLAQVLRARAAQEATEYPTARREVMTLPRCGGPLPILALGVKAHLQQAGFPTAPLGEIRSELYALRNHGGLSPAEELMTLEVEARLLLADNPAQGAGLFREIVAQDGTVAASDVLARNVLAAAYAELALQEGAAGQGSAAFAQLVRQWRLPKTVGCAVGVVVTGERSLVVVRGPDGQVSRPLVTSTRDTPLLDVAHLVPEHMQQPLQGCAEVRIMASPVLHGHAALLDRSLRWAFQGERHRTELAERATADASWVFVDAGDETPRAPWTARIPHPGVRTLLRGTQATPGQVLQRMPQAKAVVFWTHGLLQEGRSMLRLVPDDEDEGNAWLTAAAIQARPVPSAPLVFLEQLPLATRMGTLREPWSLATAFIEGGTEIVIASPQRGMAINAAFARIGQAIAQGMPPAEAVWRERVAHGGASDSITVYQ